MSRVESCNFGTPRSRRELSPEALYNKIYQLIQQNCSEKALDLVCSATERQIQAFDMGLMLDSLNYGDLDLAKALLNALPPNKRYADAMGSVLNSVIKREHLAMVKMIIELTPEESRDFLLNESINDSNEISLHTAARTGNVDIAETLVKAISTPERKLLFLSHLAVPYSDEQPFTPIQIALGCNNLPMVQYLAHAGSDISPARGRIDRGCKEAAAVGLVSKILIPNATASKIVKPDIRTILIGIASKASQGFTKIRSKDLQGNLIGRFKAAISHGYNAWEDNRLGRLVDNLSDANSLLILGDAMQDVGISLELTQEERNQAVSFVLRNFN